MKKQLILSLCALATLSASAQKRAFELEDVYRVKYVSSPCVSATGTVAYGTTRQDVRAQKSYSNVMLLTPKGKTPQQLAAAEPQAVTTDNMSFSPFWSQDGTTLYFSSYASGTTQLYRWRDGKSEQITDYKLGVAGAIVSPDGKLVAFAAEVDPDLNDPDGSKNKEVREAKRQNPIQAHLSDELLFRHWDGYTDGKFWHIIVYNTETKTYTDVTPGRFHSPVFSPGGAEGFAFSPDSKEICYLSNHDAHPEASTNCDLWTVPVTGGEARCLTKDNPAWDGSPQYSPDGRYIAYRLQRTPSYESDRFILALIDRQTGEKTILTEDYDNWVDEFKWSSDSKTIYFLGQERGYRPLYAVDVQTKKRTLLLADRAIGAFDLDQKGNVYYTYSTTGHPAELYIAQPKGRANSRLGGPTATKKNVLAEAQVTHLNDSLVAVVDIRPSEQMWVVGADGDSVECFIVKPHGFDPAKKYPLVINVHGGPQMQWMDSYRPDWQVYPGAGYVVAYPNPHGSTGYGQAFCRGISGSWGGRPYEDVMRVTDALANLEYVDSTRMGAMGWSYGGYFMNWLQGHTKRFKCLASMMGVYDLNAMWGTTEELWFPNFELEGQPWNSKLYEKWNPDSYRKNFSTPTLIITGERDYRVSYNQSLAYFTTLQTLGVPSRIIVYDNDGHWPSGLKSMPLYYNAHLEWFHKYLGGQKAPFDSREMVKRNPWK